MELYDSTDTRCLTPSSVNVYELFLDDALDTQIQDAVQKGQLRFLRWRVHELLKLQPQREDMRRLLDVLPEGPELPKEFTNSIGMRFVRIQPGLFIMGSNEADAEKPPHTVEITQPFYHGQRISNVLTC